MAFSNIGIRCESLKLALVHSQIYRPWYVVKALVYPKTVMLPWSRDKAISYHDIMAVICLFVLRFCGLVNPVGSCRARSVYLTIRLLGRLSPLSG